MDQRRGLLGHAFFFTMRCGRANERSVAATKMNIQVFNEPLTLDIFGFSSVAVHGDRAGTAFTLSGKMWSAVKSNNLKNKGINIWIYELNAMVFAGVELDEVPPDSVGLEQKSITLTKYAYYKHVGSYSLIKQAGAKMQNELKSRGLETCLPHIEIYGHWTGDETTSETELFVSLK
jgi:hypothetical protein